jgi:hypothetical protein
MPGRIQSDDAPLAIAEPGCAWNVAWTKSRCEKSLVEFFDQKCVRSYLPLVHKRHVYGSRERIHEIPLFSGYVFFDASSIERTDVFSSRKVAEILAPSEPLQLARELSNLQLALQCDPTLKETRFGLIGKPVIVARGPMKGLEGDVVRMHSGSRLIVRVAFLGRAAEMQIDEAFLEPRL